MSKSAQAFSRKFETFGIKCLYIALAIVFIWIGVMKFTAYEANGIAPLVSNNLFLGWVYDVMLVRTFSSLLGILEIIINLLLLGCFVPARLRLAYPAVFGVTTVIPPLLPLLPLECSFHSTNPISPPPRLSRQRWLDQIENELNGILKRIPYAKKLL